MTTELIDSLVGLAKINGDAPMVYPIIHNEKANPVIFSKEGLVALLEIGGDKSGFELTKKFKETAITLELDDDSTQFNVNTNIDYRELIERYEKE